MKRSHVLLILMVLAFISAIICANNDWNTGCILSLLSLCAFALIDMLAPTHTKKITRNSSSLTYGFLFLQGILITAMAFVTLVMCLICT